MYVSPLCRATLAEHMLDDMDEPHKVHSVGVVENPLYSDQEDYDEELDKKDLKVSRASFPMAGCMSYLSTFRMYSTMTLILVK